MIKQNKFNFWQDHSPHYLEMALRQDRRKTMTRPNGHGKRTGGCGDTVEIYLSIRKGRIQSVSFDTIGCLNTTASANTVAELAEGKEVEAAWEITPEDVANYLETLPLKHMHCAELAVGALYLALRNYQEFKRDPWIKLYQ